MLLQIAIFLEKETIIEHQQSRTSIFVFKVEKINNISFYKIITASAIIIRRCRYRHSSWF